MSHYFGLHPKSGWVMYPLLFLSGHWSQMNICSIITISVVFSLAASIYRYGQRHTTMSLVAGGRLESIRRTKTYLVFQ